MFSPLNLLRLILVTAASDKYAYMLEGFNSDWLYADGTQRRVTYTNLDPGHYTFKVKVLNSGWCLE